MGMDISLLLANVIGPNTDMPPPHSLLACWEPGLPEAYLEPTRIWGQGCALQSARGHMPRALHPPHGYVALERPSPFLLLNL